MFSWLEPKPIDHPVQRKRWFKAVFKQNVPCIEEMLAAGFDPSTTNEDGYHALDLCVMRGLNVSLDSLLLRGNPNLKDPGVLSPGALVEGVRRHHFKLVVDLLNRGAPADALDVSGDNLLGVLVLQEHPSVRHINLAQGWAVDAFRALVLAGVDPDHENAEGVSVRTYLHQAISAGPWPSPGWPIKLVESVDLDEARALGQARAMQQDTPPAPTRPRPRF